MYQAPTLQSVMGDRSAAPFNVPTLDEAFPRYQTLLKKSQLGHGLVLQNITRFILSVQDGKLSAGDIFKEFPERPFGNRQKPAQNFAQIGLPYVKLRRYVVSTAIHQALLEPTRQFLKNAEYRVIACDFVEIRKRFGLSASEELCMQAIYLLCVGVAKKEVQTFLNVSTHDTEKLWVISEGLRSDIQRRFKRSVYTAIEPLAVFKTSEKKLLKFMLNDQLTIEESSLQMQIERYSTSVAFKRILRRFPKAVVQFLSSEPVKSSARQKLVFGSFIEVAIEDLPNSHLYSSKLWRVIKRIKTTLVPPPAERATIAAKIKAKIEQPLTDVTSAVLSTLERSRFSVHHDLGFTRREFFQAFIVSHSFEELARRLRVSVAVLSTFCNKINLEELALTASKAVSNEIQKDSFLLLLSRSPFVLRWFCRHEPSSSMLNNRWLHISRVARRGERNRVLPSLPPTSGLTETELSSIKYMLRNNPSLDIAETVPRLAKLIATFKQQLVSHRGVSQATKKIMVRTFIQTPDYWGDPSNAIQLMLGALKVVSSEINDKTIREGLYATAFRRSRVEDESKLVALCSNAVTSYWRYFASLVSAGVDTRTAQDFALYHACRVTFSEKQIMRRLRRLVSEYKKST